MQMSAERMRNVVARQVDARATWWLVSTWTLPGICTCLCVWSMTRRDDDDDDDDDDYKRPQRQSMQADTGC